ncbi:precorrin-8X methylmutase [Rhodoferax sp. 4810]|uniref:Precorrin-8X methylmutase n=1 Tax=Thiospirillum jenense TaxID=1653858 RepID=A0A839HED1_9GAMM|nr:precorrin-8X methylmutase [Thiospirillum jenense]MBB1075455.1 precorrin-8X methylmutase [Rhodoferax jenense]MBB1126834.1 precorrin-8X methylmutase [Thiospirillum jenense]
MKTTGFFDNHFTIAGSEIERESFAIIDAEAGAHTYSPEQWQVVRRMIHATADFELNGLTQFHYAAIPAATAALQHGTARTLIADVAMIVAGLSTSRIQQFHLKPHQFINDDDVIQAAHREGSTRATQAMRKAARLGLLDNALIGIGNAPTALLELLRLIDEEAIRPALIIGIPVGFVAAAESKIQLTTVMDVPWISVKGRKGGSTLVVAAFHALFALANTHD